MWLVIISVLVVLTAATIGLIGHWLAHKIDAEQE